MSITISGYLTKNWVKPFLNEARRHPGAIDSLELLKREGMDTNIVIRFLSQYADPHSVRRQRAARRWADRMAKRLSKTQKIVKDTANWLSNPLDEVVMAEARAFDGSREKAALYSLPSVVEELEMLRQHYKRLSSQKGKARDEKVLVHLCMTVQATTGREHWGDLAYLLQVAFALYGNDKAVWDQDVIRKIVDRYCKANPKVCANMKDFIFSGSKARSTAPIKRSTRNRRTPRGGGSEPLSPSLALRRRQWESE